MRSRPSPLGPRVLQASDVFVGFLCLYLLTAARSVPAGDAIPMWEAAQSLVRGGGFAIPTRWPVNAPVGVGGHYYPVAALLACLIHVPGALLQAALDRWRPGHAASYVVITAQLGPLLAGAAVPALLFRLLRQLRYDTRQAAWTALLLGAGTSVWVYAHRPYSEVVQAGCFLLFFAALLRAAELPTRANALRLGLTFALLVNAKNVYVACLPGALIYGYGRLRHHPRRGAVLAWTALGSLPGVLALAWYNHVRWGTVTNSGYGGVTAGFWNEHPLVGLWGQLLSPGKSIFLYAPPLVLSLWGARRFCRHRPAAAAALALVIGPVVLLYSRYLFWSGDWGWGPRYLVFAMPVLMIPAAEVFDVEDRDAALPAGGRRARRWGRVAVLGVLLAGVAVQILGSAFYWDDFINIARQAQRGWLGQPDIRGTVLAPYPCFSCFEEVYPVEWLPPMQPIVGHWWLLRHKLADDDWKTAAADAPWRRYTALSLDIQASYQAAAIDWWPFAADPGKRWPVALVSFCLLLAIPLRPWLRALRPPPARN